MNYSEVDEVVICGHSSGAALASYFALLLKHKLEDADKLRVYLFDPVPTGNDEFVDFFNSQIPFCLRIIHMRDYRKHHRCKNKGVGMLVIVDKMDNDFITPADRLYTQKGYKTLVHNPFMYCQNMMVQSYHTVQPDETITCTSEFVSFFKNLGKK